MQHVVDALEFGRALEGEDIQGLFDDAQARLVATRIATDGAQGRVEEPLDVLALERTGEFKGLYHVLHGAISPIDGIGPERLKIRELLVRVDEAQRDGARFTEVIIATNPTLEGEATAMYLAERMETAVGVVSRIARAYQGS